MPRQLRRCHVCGFGLETPGAEVCSERCACRLLDVRKVRNPEARYVEGNRLMGVDPAQLPRRMR